MIETVMTYDEWELLHSQKQREKKNRIRYSLKQKCLGLCALAIGVLSPILIQDATISIITIPAGLYLIVSKHII